MTVKSDYQKLKEKHECDLCGTKENIELYVGGPFSWLCPSCADISEKVINRYIEYISSYPLSFFAHTVVDVLKERDNS